LKSLFAAQKQIQGSFDKNKKMCFFVLDANDFADLRNLSAHHWFCSNEAYTPDFLNSQYFNNNRFLPNHS